MRKSYIVGFLIFVSFSFLLTKDKPPLSCKYYKKNSLMWYLDTPREKNYEDANNYCNNLKAKGYSDWHLPSLNELRTIFVGCEQVKDPSFCDLENFVESALKGNCSCERKNKTDSDCYRNSVFKTKQCSQYWTKTMLEKSCKENCPFLIDFTKGSIVAASPLNKYNFFCVREIKNKGREEEK